MTNDSNSARRRTGGDKRAPDSAAGTGAWMRRAVLFAALCAAGQASAQMARPAAPAADACSIVEPPIDPGSTPAFPGHWYNPKRQGTGWDFYYADVNGVRYMIGFWYAFDRNHVPVWYRTDLIDITSTSPTWSAELFRVTLNSSGSTSYRRVGTLGGRFFPGSATHIGINWTHEDYPGTYSECLYDIFRASPVNQPSSAESNPSYNGNWYDPAHGNWGYNYSMGRFSTGEYVETEKALIYDKTGNPVWLMGVTSSPTEPPNNTTGTPRKLDYISGVKHLDEDCTVAANCLRVWGTQASPLGTVARNFTGPNSATGSIAVNVPANLNNGSVSLPNAQVVWPNPDVVWPAGVLTNPTAMVKGTVIDHVYVGNSYCVAPNAASTCDVYVGWASTPQPGGSPNHLYRRNLATNAISQVSAQPNGSLHDWLAPGSRVQYELRSGSATGVLVGESAEVLVTVATSGGGNDSTSGPPDAAPAPTPFQEPTLDDASDRVGALGGEFKVSEGGHATYRVDVYAPRGRGGLTPSVALSYSSAGGEGLLGTGFNLEAASSIQKCRSGKEFGDGDTVSSDLNQFCLDGQRLLLWKGTHMQAGAEYRTEVESFQRIVLSDATPLPATMHGTNGTVPTYAFTVYGKDGTVRRFGGSAGTVVARSFGNRGTAISWLQTEQADASGNTLTYTYSSQGSGTLTMPGERVLTQIGYTGGRVVFDYRASGRRDLSHSSLGDAIASQLLNAVTVRDENDKVIRYYPVTYANAVVSAVDLVRPRVTQIRECADTAQAVCYAPTTFAWQDVVSSVGTPNTDGSGANRRFPGLVSHRLADFDGDGRTDIAWIDNGRRLNVLYSRPDAVGINFSTNTEVVRLDGVDPVGAFQTIDLNADGLDDLIYLSRSQTNTGRVSWYLRLSTGSGFGAAELLLDNVGYADTSSTLKFESNLVDHTGDGLPDLVYRIGVDSNRIAIMERVPGDNERPYRFAQPLLVRLMDDANGAFGCAASTYTARRDEERAQVVDVDGDGRGDLRFMSSAAACGSGGIVIGGVAPGTEVPQTEAPTIEEPGPDTPLGTPVAYYFVTYRAEGVVNGEFRFMRTTRTVRVIENHDENSSTRASQRVISADVNADGYMDVVYLADNGQWRSNLTVGDTVFGYEQCVANCLNANHIDKVQLLDYDGDGRLDFWWPNSATPNRNYQVYLWKGDAFTSVPVDTGFVATSGNDWRRLPADFDGDGLIDNLLIKPFAGSSGDGGWQVYRSNSHHRARGVVGAITDGLGARTTIEYSPLTFASVYRRDYDASVRNWARGSAVFDMALPNYVVQYVGSSAPTPGDPADEAYVQYQYAGLKMQAGGRGSLGFRRVTTVDLQTAVSIDTTFYQEFPFAGLPQQTRTRKLAALPVDVCRTGSQINELGAGCYARTPVCPSGKLHICDPGFLEPANSISAKVLSSNYGWRYQRATLSDANGASDLNDYTQGLQTLPPPANVPVPSIFVALRLTNTTNFSDDGQQTSFTASQFQGAVYDDFGNPTTSKVTVRGRMFPQAGQDDTSTTLDARSQYVNDPVAWKLGRLMSTRTFNTRVETRSGVVTTTTQGRRASFTYTDPSNPSDVRGLLRSERVEAMVGTSVDALSPDTTVRGVATYYTLDAFGNRTNTATCSTDVPESTCRILRAGLGSYVFHPAGPQVMRYVRNAYDSLGRYVQSTSEAISAGADAATEVTTGTVILRNAGGDPLQTQDANGLVTQLRYGKLGRQRFAYTPDGTSVRTDWIACTAGNCPANLALAYIARTTTSGAPTRWTFHDVLGRPTLALTQGLNGGDYVAVLTQYDARGNARRVSEPFYANDNATGAATPRAGETLAWTTTNRDHYGRVYQTIGPNSAATTTAFLGRTTVTTLPPNAAGVQQTLTEVRSPQGEVIATTDHKGMTVAFAYDATGQVLTTTRNGKVTATTYDGLGRKLRVADPDAGTWNYAVNDAGETIQQLSPRNTCTQQRYDGRGRVWKRIDYGTGCGGAEYASATWQFDTAAFGVGKLASEQFAEGGAVSVTRTIAYNGVGQAVSVSTAQDGRTYLAQSTYDQYGRAFQGFFTAPGLPTTGEKNTYNAQGYATAVRSAYPAGTGPVYHEVLEMNARGSVTRERKAIGTEIVTTRQFDTQTGRLRGQQVQGGMLQNLALDYDPIGNVRYREATSGGVTQRETFAYDELQRLTSSTFTRNGATTGTSAQTYDGEGNILTKSGRNYAYSGSTAGTCATQPGVTAPGPHAVTRAGTTDYCYDPNGNVVRILGGGDDRTLSYTAYDLVKAIRSDATNVRTNYNYGPNREKVRRLDYASATAFSPSAITEYVSGAEVRWVNNAIEEVARYAGAVIVKQRRNGANYVVTQQYLIVDAQGSTDVVLDIWGQPVNPTASMSFDAFGQRRSAGTWTAPMPWTPSLRTELLATTRHGYTGHEQVDEAGIVHMNGRIYDPALGRFLQADPFVQSPGNSQSHNRYSYVFNNPMAYTDPTGYFGSKERQGVRAAAAIVISIFLPGALTSSAIGMTTTQAAIVTGAVAGAVQSGNARGAALGALTAAAFVGVDRAINVDVSKAAFKTPATQMRFAARALANGAVGGVLSSVQGGRFGHGFISAGLGDYLGPVNPQQTDMSPAQMLGSAMAGGTLSAVSGGDFANGAMTAAFKGIVRSAKQGAENTRMAALVYGDRQDWVAFEWDVFVFGGLVGEPPIPSPVKPVGEVIGVAGVSSEDGGYVGAIAAGGLHVGGHSNYVAHLEGYEVLSGGGAPERISLTEVGVGVEVPFVAGAGFSLGRYATHHNSGGFLSVNGGVLGERAALGVGGSVNFDTEIGVMRDWMVRRAYNGQSGFR
ncbi:RHS repeat-associated core domain-containing protein [Tahibacter soli]|uniref:SpvB/TcaC N-terminal domain-containing protein n=1 Tax=Tahibacter soli TaxID=2983605 RepID=A0A9X3YFY9_9GAMM|nr:RHS repeat-associated core domain-containing protein [Tahibacter soli]MDC8011242.1 SpvB/TcaC N-terminal domain-containing protein [Tahibacter soli]